MRRQVSPRVALHSLFVLNCTLALASKLNSSLRGQSIRVLDSRSKRRRRSKQRLRSLASILLPSEGKFEDAAAGRDNSDDVGAVLVEKGAGKYESRKVYPEDESENLIAPNFSGDRRKRVSIPNIQVSRKVSQSAEEIFSHIVAGGHGASGGTLSDMPLIFHFKRIQE